MKRVAIILTSLLFAAFAVAQEEAPDNRARVLLYADFERIDSPVAYSAGEADILENTLANECDGAYGRGVKLVDGRLSLDVSEFDLFNEGTVSFAYRRVRLNDNPDEGEGNAFLSIQDEAGKTLFEMNVLGHLTTPDVIPGNRWGGGFPQLIPTDKLSYEWRNAAITWRRGEGARPGSPDVVRLWTDHGVAGWREVELFDSSPAALTLTGGEYCALEIDELFVVDRALSGRALFELDRNRQRDITALEERLNDARTFVESSETWRRDAAIIEALKRESVVVKQAEGILDEDQAATRYDYGNPGLLSVGEGTRVDIDVPEAGRYAVLLRYQRDRYLDHDQELNAEGLFWRNNFADITCRIAGREFEEKFYPTGRWWLWSCDTEVYRWRVLNGGEPINLPAGNITIEFDGGGIDLDLVALTSEPIPSLSEPRWIDKYQIPPQMLVEDMTEEKVGDEIRREYTLVFRSRLEEPMRYEIDLDECLLDIHRAELLTDSIEFTGRGQREKVRVAVYHPDDGEPSSEKVLIHLWHDNTPAWMEYWLQDIARRDTPEAPRSEPAVDPEAREWTLEWLEADAVEQRRMEHEQQTLGRRREGLSVFEKSDTLRRVRPHLDRVEYFMSLTPEDLDALLPDGPSHSNGNARAIPDTLGRHPNDWLHGIGVVPDRFRDQSRSPHGWRMWHEPAGDVDMAEVIYGENWLPVPDRRGEFKYVFGEWRRGEPGWRAILEEYRFQMWMRFMGNQRYRTWDQCAIPLLSRVYHLTGDDRYAEQCYRIIERLSDKCWFNPKKFFNLHRDDRDNWGSTGGNKWPGWNNLGYSTEALNAYDRVRSALTEDERFFWEYNGVRAVFRDIASSGRSYDVSWPRAINMESPYPSALAADAFGDVDFDRQNIRSVSPWLDQIYDDGMHVCGLSTYGAPGSYGRHLRNFLRDRIEEHYPFWKNPEQYAALLKAVEAGAHFMFANSMVPNIGHGAGNPWCDANTLGPDDVPMLLETLRDAYERNPVEYDKAFADIEFACADGAIRDLHGMFEYLEVIVEIPRRIIAARRPRPLEENFNELYEDFELTGPEHQPTRVAKVRGIGILRNRRADDWRDWVEVIFDYGLPNTRAHSDRAKLHIILFGSGQIQNVDYGYHRWHAAGSPLWRGWAEHTVSHCTVMVDEEAQRTARGYLGFVKDFGPFQALEAYSPNLYSGVDMRRAVVAAEGYALDIFFCQADRERQFDWMWHNYGDLQSELPFEPVERIGDARFYQWVEDAASAPAPDYFRAQWENVGVAGGQNFSIIEEPHTMRMHGLALGDAELFRFAGPHYWPQMEGEDEEGEGRLGYFWTRKTGENAVFVHLLETFRNERGSRVDAMESTRVVNEAGEIVPPERAVAIRVNHGEKDYDLFIRNLTGGVVSAGGFEVEGPLMIVSRRGGNIETFSIDGD